MKYFTKDLWLAWNHQGPLDPNKAIDIGNTAFSEYRQEIEALKAKLGSRIYDFFLNESLHDGRVLSFTVGDGIDHEVNGPRAFDINDSKTRVTMRVLGANLDVLYTLRYEGLRRVVFDFPSDQPLFYNQGDNIGDWGYDEFSVPDGEYIKHEVLFSSGTSIALEFKEFSYEKEPCKGSRYLDSS
jgi:hypothetical protein